jgi:hypothetical protein
MATIVEGESAQDVFSFYDQRDAYPFGRSRLATVLPGGKIVQTFPSPRADAPGLGRPLAAAPAREGTVKYLVYDAT